MPQKYGSRANLAAFDRRKPCEICGDPEPRYSWTDYHGEGYCLECGTPYQLMAGELQEGETYPRININRSWIPVLCLYFCKTKKGNGLGTFMTGRDYIDQLHDREKFNAWLDEHKELVPVPAA